MNKKTQHDINQSITRNLKDKMNSSLRAFITIFMGLCKTTLKGKIKNLPKISIRCGIYQGDAWSPLLFCLGLSPLSQIINKTGNGYRLRNGTTLSHLEHMNDIKLCAKSVRDTNRIYSRDIVMLFGPEKCCWMVTMRKKVVHT